MFVCRASVRHLCRDFFQSTGATHSPIQRFRTAWQARQFRILFSALVLQALGAGAAIAADAQVTKVQRAGPLTGVWTGGEMAAFAIGSALVLILHAATGFVSRTEGTTVDQSDSAVTDTTQALALLPAIPVALSLPLFLRYSSGKICIPREQQGDAGTSTRF
jgi:Na+/melibiose symporter-like transporter